MEIIRYFYFDRIHYFESRSSEIEADNLSIADKSEAKATAETEKSEVEASLKATETEIADLEKFE